MACRGIYLAMSFVEVSQLLAVEGNDKQVIEILHAIEGKWDEEHLQEVDKSWDAMHRCLSDGTLNLQSGIPPLSLCVLGGRQLYKGTGYIVSFLENDKVCEVSATIQAIDKEWLRKRYYSLSHPVGRRALPGNYEGPISENDFNYTWEYFDLVKTFYAHAAAENRATVFYVDQ